MLGITCYTAQSLSGDWTLRGQPGQVVTGWGLTVTLLEHHFMHCHTVGIGWYTSFCNICGLSVQVTGWGSSHTLPGILGLFVVIIGRLHVGIMCYTPGDSELYVMMMEGITHGDHVLHSLVFWALCCDNREITHGDHVLHSWGFWALCYDDGRDYTWGSCVTLLGFLSSMLWWGKDYTWGSYVTLLRILSFMLW